MHTSRITGEVTGVFREENIKRRIRNFGKGIWKDIETNKNSFMHMHMCTGPMLHSHVLIRSHKGKEIWKNNSSDLFSCVYRIKITIGMVMNRLVGMAL